MGRKHTSRRAAAMAVLLLQEVGVAGAGPITEATGFLPEEVRIFLDVNSALKILCYNC